MRKLWSAASGVMAMGIAVFLGGGQLWAQADSAPSTSPPPIYGGVPSQFGLLPRPTDESKLQPSGWRRILSPPPASWDWRSHAGTTPVKDQDPFGACWAFASVGSVEAMVRLHDARTLDLSEYNLVGCNPFGANCNSGGSDYYGAVLWTQKGLALEKQDRYYQCPTAACNTVNAKSIMPLGWRYLANDVAEIKDAVYNIGPVITTIYASDPAFQGLAAGAVYYYTGTEATNHLVLIVGYDDNKVHAGGTGAWLIKNSWGTTWSDSGYGWVAYGSASIGASASVYTEYEDYNPNEKLIYYDEHGCDAGVGYSDGDDWGMVRISPPINGNLTRVDFWTRNINATYKVRIYDDFNGTTLSNLLRSQDGSCTKKGYYSIPLASPLPVTAANDIFIAIEFIIPGELYPIPLDASGPHETNKCYISNTGSSWSVYNSYDVAIRARILPPDGDADLLPDSWETAYSCLNSGVNDAAADPDHDQLTNFQEALYGTGPCVVDTDAGHDPDGWEAAYVHNPASISDDGTSVKIEPTLLNNAYWQYPLYTGVLATRTQSIVLASEIGMAGSIRAVSLNVSQVPGLALTNFTIRMKHTALSAFSTGTLDATGWTVVYQAATTISATGLKTFTLTTPFTYDGTNNLMIDFSFKNTATGTSGFSNYYPTAALRSVYATCSSSCSDPLTWSGPSYSRSSNIPAVRLDLIPSSQDSDGDGLTNIVEAFLGTDKNLADTDHDGASDGAEVNTYHTNPLSWDSDSDRLPDGYEIANLAHVGGALDPLNAIDAAADYDGDDNSNLNEYWNGSDPWTIDPTPGQYENPGCYFWADADGDGTPAPSDLVMLKLQIAGVAQSYQNILPHGIDTLDLDRDGNAAPSDQVLLKLIVALSERLGGYPSQALSLEKVDGPSGSVAVGSTTHVTVSVHSVSGGHAYAPGFGVVFEVVSGNAVLLGGDGTANGGPAGNRYDFSMEAAAGAKANMVVLVTGSGAITLGVKIPACGANPIGRWNNQVLLASPVVINP
jgi:hypothetical protein